MSAGAVTISIVAVAALAATAVLGASAGIRMHRQKKDKHEALKRLRSLTHMMARLRVLLTEQQVGTAPVSDQIAELKVQFLSDVVALSDLLDRILPIDIQDAIEALLTELENSFAVIGGQLGEWYNAPRGPVNTPGSPAALAALTQLHTGLGMSSRHIRNHPKYRALSARIR